MERGRYPEAQAIFIDLGTYMDAGFSKTAHLLYKEVYANEIADAFVEYDGSSVFAEEKTKAKVRPIGKQYIVYDRYSTILQ